MILLARYSKYLVALVGALAQLVPALGLHGSTAHIVQVVLALLTAEGVRLTPNAAPAPQGNA